LAAVDEAKQSKTRGVRKRKPRSRKKKSGGGSGDAPGDGATDTADRPASPPTDSSAPLPPAPRAEVKAATPAVTPSDDAVVNAASAGKKKKKDREGRRKRASKKKKAKPVGGAEVLGKLQQWASAGQKVDVASRRHTVELPGMNEIRAAIGHRSLIGPRVAPPPIGMSTSSAWTRAGAAPSAGATQQFWPVWAEQTETWERARLKQWVVWAEEEERLRRVIELPTERKGRATARANTGSGRPLICPYRLVGCEAMCARETLVDHLATCRHRQRQIVGSSLLLCPHSVAGCTHRVRLADLASHLSCCDFALAPGSPRPGSSGGNGGRSAAFSADYEVVCPYSSFGCTHTCMRAAIPEHLVVCTFANEGGDEVAGARADAAVDADAATRRAARGRGSSSSASSSTSSSNGGGGRASPSTTSETVAAEDYEVVCPYASFGYVLLRVAFVLFCMISPPLTALSLASLCLPSSLRVAGARTRACSRSSPRTSMCAPPAATRGRRSRRSGAARSKW
jgi:hypothetical protein